VRDQTVASLFILLILVSLGSTGCQTISEHQKTAIGTGAGAAGGALIGGVISRNATGAVVGGLLGGLVGGGIGYYLERQDRTPTQAASDTGWTPAQGNLIRVDGVQANPAQVRAGDTVNLTTTYTVLTPQANHLVRETHEVRHDGVLVANPTTEFSRTNGTFTSALPITVPATAPRGTYEVTTTIASGDRLSRASTRFTVN
jgi:surface antigen